MSFAGSIRERVSLERRATTRDELGGATGDWIELALVWASFRPDGAARATDGDARGDVRRWVVNARPCDAAAGDRIVRVGGKVLVTGVVRDPATPDRITIYAEDLP